jgi:hypothetical protein
MADVRDGVAVTRERGDRPPGNRRRRIELPTAGIDEQACPAVKLKRELERWIIERLGDKGSQMKSVLPAAKLRQDRS